MRSLLTFFAALVVGMPAVTGAQANATGFLNRAITVNGAERRYQVYVPRGYTKQTKWPVILALHGGGERGGDGLKQTEVGLGRAIRLHEERFPAIVVFPQAPADSTPGWQGPGAELALAALDKTLGKFNTDRARVYLVGLSMGANGSWYQASRNGARFAGAVIVCGWVSARRNATGLAYPPIVVDSNVFDVVAAKTKDLPLWLFHGDADALVPVTESRNMFAALQRAGGNVQYTEYPGINHPSWDKAFDTPELWAWLFAQRRK